MTINPNIVKNPRTQGLSSGNPTGKFEVWICHYFHPNGCTCRRTEEGAEW